MQFNTKAIFIFAVMVSIFWNWSCTKAPGVKKQYTVGIINLNEQLVPTVEEFKRAMAEFGYEDGRNVTYIYQGVATNAQEAAQRAAAMAAQKVDLIYTLTTPATLAAKKAVQGTKIPVVFGPVHSPVESGIVDSLTVPGGNVTGIRVRGSSPKLLEWFLQLKPDAKTVYVPYHLGNSPSMQNLEDLTAAAGVLGLEIVSVPVSTEKELMAALDNIPAGIDALWLTHSHLLVNNVDKYTAASLKHNIMTLGPVAQTSGITLTYSAHLIKIGGQAARLANRILQGADPATLPVETADFYLGINLKNANQLGIHVQDVLLNMADSIFR